jgi:hypothetical protein
MFTEIVLFPVPKGFTRAHALARFRDNAALWRGKPGLLRKQYLFDETSGRAGGAYLWTSREAAAAAHNPAWQAEIARMFGAPPSIEIFETPVVVDNEVEGVRMAA